jgi:hypothetical protein
MHMGLVNHCVYHLQLINVSFIFLYIHIISFLIQIQYLLPPIPLMRKAPLNKYTFKFSLESKVPIEVS